MRNELLRKILGYAGIALSGYAVGTVFGLALTAFSLGLFIYFLWLVLAAILAMIGVTKWVIPTVQKFIAGDNSGVSSLIPNDLVAKIKARFATNEASA